MFSGADAAQVAMKTSASTRILVVEDENIVAKDIAARLRSLGYAVCGPVATGAEAVALARETDPDLVLMDIMLRGQMDGVAAAEEISQASDAPIIYLTAYSDSETLERAKVTQPYGYVLKPFDDRDLHTAIEMALYRARMERRLKAAEDALADQRVRRIRADHLRSLGEMAAGIAHELRQPLTILYGIGEQIKLTLERKGEIPAPELTTRADTILAQAERMEHIIERVRLFAREAGKSEASLVQVNDMVRTAIDMVAHTYQSNGIEVDTDLAEGLPGVRVNPYSLEEVCLNLLNNARDAVASRQPGHIRIETRQNGGPGSGDVVVTISDNGVGVPADALSRVFDPFYTTKPVEKGTGLGLSVCKTLVEEAGGRMVLESTEGEGTTASVRLPADRGGTQAADPSSER